MIIDRVQPDIDEDFDLFSFAGRVAFVGGTGLAVKKAYEDYQSTPVRTGARGYQRSNIRMEGTLKNVYKEVLGNPGEGEAAVTRSKSLRSFGSQLKRDHSRISTVELAYDKNFRKNAGFNERMNDIKKAVGTKSYHFDNKVPDLLDAFIEKNNHRMKGLQLKYVEGEAAQVVIRMKGEGKNKGRTHRIDLRNRSGRIWKSKDLSSPYVSGGVITGIEGKDLQIRGSGSAKLEQLIKNDSVTELRALEQELAGINEYDPSGLPFEKKILNGQKTTRYQIAKTKLVQSRHLNKENKAIIKAGIEQGFFGGTEEDKYLGNLFYGDEYGSNPHNASIGQAGSVNSHQAYGRNYLLKDNFEKSKINWDRRFQDLNDQNHLDIRSNNFKANVAYITPEARASLLPKTQAKTALSEEGLIQDIGVKFKSVDANRTLRISMDGVGEGGEKLLDEIAKAKGIKGTKEERIEELLSSINNKENPLTSFDDELFNKKISEILSPKNVLLNNERLKIVDQLKTQSKSYEEYQKQIDFLIQKNKTPYAARRGLEEVISEQKRLKGILDDTIWGEERHLTKKLWKKRHHLKRVKQRFVESEKEVNRLLVNAPLSRDGKIQESDYRQRLKSAKKNYNEQIKEQRSLEAIQFKKKSTKNSFLGESINGDEVLLRNKHQDLHLADVTVDHNTREIVFGLAEVSDETKRMKVKTGGGAGKRYVEHILDIKKEIFAAEGLDYDRAISEYNKKNGTQLSQRLDFASYNEVLPIKNGKINWDKLERESGPLIKSIAEKHHGAAEEALRAVYKKHGMTNKGIKTFANGRKDPLTFLEEVGNALAGKTLTKESAIEKAVLSSMDEVAPGVFVSSHIFGLQESKTFSGAGQKASMSARQGVTLNNLGLDSLLQEFSERRVGGNRKFREYIAFDELKSSLENDTVKGIDLSENKKELREILHRSEDAPALRQIETFKNKNQIVGKNIVVDLGEDLGHKKVAIVLDDMLSDHLLKTYGTEEMSRMNKITSNLFNTNLSKDAREAEYLRYTENMKTIDKGIKKNVLSGKIKGSMTGKVTPLTYYQEAFLQEEKIASNKNIVFMHNADIERQYGKKALDEVLQKKYYGWLTREPAEGFMSSSGVQVFSAEDAYEKYSGKRSKLPYNKGEVYLSNKSTDFYKAMFGDFDGDAVSILGSQNKQLKDFVEMNTETKEGRLGKIFREGQEEFGNITQKLKARTKESILGTDYSERLLINKKISEVGKGSIGEVSEEVSRIHVGINAKIGEKGLMNLAEAEAKNYIRLNQSAHLFVENVLKAKHMSTEDIRNGRPKALLEDLMGTSKKTTNARIASVTGFMEELVYGDLYDKRHLGKDDLITELISTKNVTKQAARTEVDFILDLKKTMDLDSIVPQLIDAADVGNEVGTMKHNLNSIVQAVIGGEDPKKIKAALKKEKAIKELEQLKDVGKKGLGHFAKWAILPAAAIGLVGSLTSTPKEIHIDRETSDGNKNRKEKSSSYKANNGTQRKMTPGRHRQPSLAGTLQGESQLMRDLEAKNAAVRLTDQRGAMDHFDIQQVIDKGF